MPQHPIGVPFGSNSATVTTATSQIKSGSGVLVGVIVTSPGTSWAITLHDGIGSGATLYSFTAASGVTVLPNVKFGTGLYLSSTGTPGSLAIYYY